MSNVFPVFCVWALWTYLFCLSFNLRADPQINHTASLPESACGPNPLPTVSGTQNRDRTSWTGNSLCFERHSYVNLWGMIKRLHVTVRQPARLISLTASCKFLLSSQLLLFFHGWSGQYLLLVLLSIGSWTGTGSLQWSPELGLSIPHCCHLQSLCQSWSSFCFRAPEVYFCQPFGPPNVSHLRPRANPSELSCLNPPQVHLEVLPVCFELGLCLCSACELT